MGKERRRMGIIGWLMVLLSILFALALLLSYTSLFVHPEKIWFIPFLGMAYPYLAAANLFFLIYWFLRRRRYFIYPLIALLAGAGLISRYYGSGTDEQAAENTVGIMSYNVHVFGRWKHGEDENQRIKRADSILRFADAQNPDIICFQEFYSKKRGDMNVRAKVQQRLELPHAHLQAYRDKRPGYHLATFSRYPITESGKLLLKEEEKHFAIFSDIRISKTKSIRVYNVHLKSLNIGSEEYLFTGDLDLSSEAEAKKAADGTMSILRKMKHAFEVRSKQVELLLEHMEQSPYPIVIAGDFNDTPVSYAYQQLRNNRLDAFKESGKGFSPTYVGKFPSFRIDFILHDQEISSYGYGKGELTQSDHYPVYCRLDL